MALSEVQRANWRVVPSAALVRRVVVVQLVVIAALAAAALLSGGISGVGEWDRWGDAAYLSLLAVGLVLAVGRARREEQRRWWLVALAFAGIVFGQVTLIFGWAQWLDTSFLTLADVGMLTWHGAFIAFLVVHLGHLPRWGRLVHLTEAAMLAAAAVFLVWESLILPSLGDPGELSVSSQVLVVLYPALGLFEAAIVALLLMVARSPGRVFLMITFLLNAVGDIAAGMSTDYPTAATLAVAGPAWLAACA
ncbi:MAG TPA: hypothetical protein DCR14_07260, partial [Acidimicrobiaceae bacterium]|nr:hypothetical protein [Acidimicrobiaceae bacterium]